MAAVRQGKVAIFGAGGARTLPGEYKEFFGVNFREFLGSQIAQHVLNRVGHRLCGIWPPRQGNYQMFQFQIWDLEANEVLCIWRHVRFLS